MLRPPLLSVLVPLLLPLCATAQVTHESAALGQVLSSGNDAFGWALDVDGDTAAVGAPGYDAGAGGNQGQVQIFVRSGASWSSGPTLQASDGLPGDTFGRAVALAGDELLIGAPYAAHGGASAAGAVYVFRRQGGLWSEVQKLTASDAVASGNFGHGLAVDGDLAVASAVGYQPGPTSSEGHVYVLERLAGNWVETQILIGDVELAEDFAWSVDVDGDRIVVGSPKDDAMGLYQSGSVYLFERSGGAFAETARLVASDGQSFDGLGESVAVSGDVVVGGSPRHDTPDFFRGAAYVFEWDGSAWVERAQLTEVDEVQGSGFGYEVALSGDLLAVQNASWAAGALAQVGSAVIFRRGACGFLPEQRVMSSNPQFFAGFGHALAFTGSTLLGGGSSGSNDTAHVFELGAGPVVASYCTAGTSASGCQAAVSACGAASASGFGPFLVTVSQVEGARKGLIFFGAAPNNLPWGSGSTSYLCVKAPTQRTGVQSSGGAPGTCQGLFALDFSAWMQANPGQAPAAGATSYLQAWFRDPASPKTTSLSDAISFPVGP